MKFTGLFVIYVLLGLTVLGQPPATKIVKVLDRSSGKAVSFATVKAANLQDGTYADSLGNFYLTEKMMDSIAISRVGYISRLVVGKNIKGDTILLEPQYIALPTLKIKSEKNPVMEEFGILQAKPDLYWGSAGWGEEYSQKIVFPDSAKGYWIRQINIPMTRYIPQQTTVLHLYTVSENGLPGDNLLPRNIVITKQHYVKRKKRLTIDVSSENIIIYSGACFVGFEWLPSSKEQLKYGTSGVSMTNQITEQLTYKKSFFFLDWVPALKFLPQVNPNNTMISVKAQVLD